jgi:hypothetical protein
MAKHRIPKGVKQLSPMEAAVHFEANPASVAIPLPELFKLSNMTQDAFLKELQSGRLRTHRSAPDSKGECAVFVRGDEAVRWLAARIKALRTH